MSSTTSLIGAVWDMTPDELQQAVLRLPRTEGPQFLSDLDDEGVTRLAPEMIAAMVGIVWRGVEYPEDAVAAEEWTSWFRTAGEGHIVRDDAVVPAPTEVPVLYRGGTRLDRMSWTSDYEVAERFARGIAFRPTDGTVWAIRDLLPELVLARVDGRNEAEWVIDIAAYTGDIEVVDDLSPGHRRGAGDRWCGHRLDR